MEKIKLQIKSISASRIEIEGEIASSVFESYFNKALKKIGEHVEIDGFRKGHVSDDVLKTKIPEIQIMDEMAEMAISDAYPTILEQEKIDAIGRPEVTITKIALGNPLGFKIVTDVLPEIKLSNYKKLAKELAKEDAVIPTDEDVEKTILELRRMRVKMEKEKDHDHSDPNHVHAEVEVKDEELPPLDDAFIFSLGGGLADVADLKNKILENMTLEKSNEVREKHRLAIMERLITEANIEPPQALVDGELNKMLFRFESDLSNMGYKLEDYVKQLGKTVDEMKQDWNKDAVKRVMIELIVRHIALAEKLEPTPAEVEPEVAKLLEMYKGADELRTKLYVEQMLVSEKVFKFLEA